MDVFSIDRPAQGHIDVTISRKRAFKPVWGFGSVFRSFLDPDPYSEYRYGSIMLIEDKMKEKCARFKKEIHDKVTQLSKNFFR